jgi:zinc protease
MIRPGLDPRSRGRVASMVARLALVSLFALPAFTVPARALGPYRVPAPEVRTLSNGLKVMVFPDPRVPVVQVQLRLPAGLDREAADQNGVANLTALMLRAGTTSRDAQLVESNLGAIGGSFLASAGREYTTLSAAFLARDLETGLDLVSDLAINPVFPEAEFQRVGAQVGRGIQQQHQSPGTIAEEQLWMMAMPGEAAARPPFGTLESLDRLTREQVRAFHRDHYRPDGALLVIAGDVTSEGASAAVEEWFGRWTSKSEAPAAPATAPAAPPAGGVRIRIVDQPSPVCELRLGLATPGREASDEIARAFALRVFQNVLATRIGGFAIGRDARSSFAPLCSGGVWMLGASGPPDSAGVLARRLRGEMRRFLAGPAPVADLAAVRRMVRQAFPLQFEPLAALMSQWVAADRCGAPQDYFERYRDRLAALTPGELWNAARQGADMERLAIVAVGPARTLEPLLKPLGEVEVIQIDAIPGSEARPDTTPPSTPAQQARGRELITRAVTAHGGADRLRGITSSMVLADVKITVNGVDANGTLRQLRKDPYKMMYLTSLEGFESRQILNGEDAWTMVGSEETVNVSDSSEVAALRAGFDSDLPHLLLAAADPRARAAWRGRERVEGHDAEAVEVVTAGGERRKLYLGDRNLLFAIDLSELDPAGHRAIARRVYSDYRDVHGVQWPFEENRFLRGARFMNLRATDVQLNLQLNELEFARPRAKPGEPNK